MRILGYEHGIRSRIGCGPASHSSDSFRIDVSLLTASQKDGKVAQEVRDLIVLEHAGWAIFPHTVKNLRKGLNSLRNLGELLSFAPFVFQLTGRGSAFLLFFSIQVLNIY